MVDLVRLRPAKVVEQRAELDELQVELGMIAPHFAADAERDRGDSLAVTDELSVCSAGAKESQRLAARESGLAHGRSQALPPIERIEARRHVVAVMATRRGELGPWR